MNMEQPEPPLAVKYVPDAGALASCVEFGKVLAEALKNKLES